MKKRLTPFDRPIPLNHKSSLILRLWRDEQLEAPNWRASLEFPDTGRRIGFASLEQLFAFLIDFTESDCSIQSIDGKGPGFGFP